MSLLKKRNKLVMFLDNRGQKESPVNEEVELPGPNVHVQAQGLQGQWDGTKGPAQ